MRESETERTYGGPEFGTPEWIEWLAAQLDRGRLVLAASPLPKVAVRWEAKAA